MLIDFDTAPVEMSDALKPVHHGLGANVWPSNDWRRLFALLALRTSSKRKLIRNDIGENTTYTCCW